MNPHEAVLAINRADTLLGLLARQHTHQELYAAARAVQHELSSARAALTSASKPESYEGDSARMLIPGRVSHRMLLAIANAGETGLSSADLARMLPDIKCITARRWELGQMGLVLARRDPAGRVVRAMGDAGRARTLWTLSEKGRRALAQLEDGQLPLDLDCEVSGGAVRVDAVCG